MFRNLWQVSALLVVFLCPAVAQKQGLSYRPVGAEYSSALDRIIMIGGNPSVLYLYDAANNITDTVALSAAPMSVSISPDGLFAAVLHSTSVSYVNLSTKSVTRVYPLPAGTSARSTQPVVLAKDWIYLPSSVSINISSGIVAGSLNSNSSVYSARLHPNGKAIYTHDSKLDVSGGALSTAGYCCDNNTIGVWFSLDGTRVYTSNGVRAASDDPSVDQTFYTLFPGLAALGAFAESASKGIAVIDNESAYDPYTAADSIRLYNSSYLSATGVLRLPDVMVGANSYKNYAKWLFFNNAGTMLYVVMQADSATGLLNDYSVETYNLGNPASCVATFGSSAAFVGGFGALGSVDLTAAADCIHQASSSANWLQIVSGGYGSGNTTLTYVARPNSGGARSATITIGGQTLTVSQDAAVATGPLNRLSVKVTAAEYTKTSDKIVYVSTLPNELHIYNPVTGADTFVPLVREPLSVSVRPDGAYAAVGHHGWISNVNLNTGTVDNIYKVATGVNDLISAGNGYIYLFPAGSPRVYSYEVGTGLMTTATGFSSGGPARLHPTGKSLYAGNAVLTHWSIEAGVARLISSDNSGCANFWIAESGDHMITSCSEVLRSPDASLEGLARSGRLWEAPGTVWAAHSTAQSAIASIPTQDNYYFIPNLHAEVQVYNDADLSLRSRQELPKFTVGGAPYYGYGRYVFWNRSATQLYVIQEADSTAGLQSGFGVAQVSPGTCNFTLTRASDSGAYSGFTGQVDVTAAPLCLWTPILNADNNNTNWIRLTSNSTGAVGTASLGYTVAANPSPASRQATIVVERQTFTITQAGNPGTLTVSPSTVTVPKEGANGYIAVTASNTSLGWAAIVPSSAASWINIAQNGVGSRNASYNISANPDGQPARTGTITINGQSVTFNQAASTGAVAYAGSLDSTNCQTVSGWAADRDRLSVPISVSIYDNSTLLTTIVANQSRPDVGVSLGDNGLHGFTYTLPASVRDSSAHSIHVVYETNYSSELYGSPKALTCTSGYTGSVDSASCSGITGWVADRNRSNTSILVSLWDGSYQVTATMASLSRPDVGAYLGDNGLHGFKLVLPAAYTNGVGQNLQVRYELSATQVYGSPVTLTCNSTYAGYIDSASCTGISGWAADRSALGRAITVSLRDGTTEIAAANATGSRPDVGAVLGDQGSHGFTLLLPTSYANGVSHTLQVYYERSTTRLGSPVTLTCGGLPAPNYVGYVDTASCSGITGWAADKNRLNSPILVSLWDGSTPIASMIANGARPDVGTFLGDSGAHGFSLPIPAAYANGVNHALQIRYETSATQLPGSPANLTCGSGAANYTGSVDALSCSAISGWAANRNALNSSIDINIYDGEALLLTMPANGLRSDVGTYLGDNGAHGFGIATPGSLKDGRAHTITVRPGNSSSPLYGQQSLTCQP